MAYKKQKTFLRVPGAGSLRSGWQHVWVRALFWVTDFLYPHVVEGARGVLGGLSEKALIPSSLEVRISM